jgi:DNA uptake protein ComE-like DNA-binding protein
VRIGQPGGVRAHHTLWVAPPKGAPAPNGVIAVKNVFMSRRLPAIAAICALGMVAVGLPGCYRSTPQNDQQLRQKSADATREVQKGAKQLATNTKAAAANAVNGVNAVAQGVKDGVKGNKNGTSSDLVDINSASTVTIALLPGISISKARDIVKRRPYRSPRSLVQRGLLTQQQFERIADKITTK